MNELNGLKLGVALCGSFCTFKKAIATIEYLVSQGVTVYPIMTDAAYATSTRFGECTEIVSRIEAITGKEIIHSIAAAEPLGPKDIIDMLLIAPCTGNTLAKMAMGITDSPVLLAANAYLL